MTTRSISDRITIFVSATFVLLSTTVTFPVYSVGLKTRDQNPIFQSYYLPGIQISNGNGWQLSQSLFITNNFHQETNSRELLVIDAENYRYDLTLGYQSKDWRFESTLPLIVINGGKLDRLIEDWHDFFRLPQNGRDSHPGGLLNIRYTRDGKVIYQQKQKARGIGDLALSFSSTISGDENMFTELSFGIEIPTGDVANNLGNDAVDIAYWISHSRALNHTTRIYGLIGRSHPGKGGLLTNEIETGIWLGQFGVEYTFATGYNGIVQLDAHSALLKKSYLDIFGHSLQMQLGLELSQIIDQYDIVLFFSEDILVGTAPDITFALQVNRRY